MLGERLTALLSPEACRLAAACVLLSPWLPLLFMGEEVGETAPFQYFVSHGDEGLIEAVRNGRRAEFSSFAWQGEAPDPQAVETFERSRPHGLREAGESNPTFRLYQALIALRREQQPDPARDQVSEGAEAHLLGVLRQGSWLCLFHFFPETERLHFELPTGSWTLRLDGADAAFGGSGQSLPAELRGAEVELSLGGYAFAVYQRGAQ